MAILKINIVTNASGAQSGINQTSSSVERLGKVGKAAAAGLAVVGVAALAVGKECFDAASKVQQSFGALESVFGKSAKQMQDWAGEAANTVGLAKSEYANLAVVLGSQLGNMGRSQAEAGKETHKLIGLGADLAATFGGSVADAVSAVSGVLKGETDPIERYGISIKAADINARLAAQGLGDLEGKALKSATATAALALLTEQATAAQGAFGRETNTAGGQQERLRANIENLKASIGKGLLPVVTATFSYLNTTAIPGARLLGAELAERLGPSVRAVGGFITGTLVPAARAFYAWFVEKIVPGIRGLVMPVVDALRDRFASVSASISANSANLSKLGSFLRTIAEIVAKVAPIVGTVLGGAIRASTGVITTMIGAVSRLIGFLDSLIGKAKAVADAIGKIPSPGDIGGFLGKLNPFGVAALIGSAPPLTTRAAPITGRSDLTTAAATGGSFGGFATFSGQAPAVNLDGRTFVSVTVNGALDPVATARSIRQLLREEDVRVGRASTYAPATGWLG